MYEWQDHGGPEAVSVEVDLSKQRATFFRGESEIGWAFVSTGKEGHTTAAGNYTITEKMPVKYSNRYGWVEDADGNIVNRSARYNVVLAPGEKYFPAPMYHWMRLTNYGVGLHAGEIAVQGQAASRGCIRLPAELAEKLYAVTQIGTPVKIIRNRPISQHPGGV